MARFVLLTKGQIAIVDDEDYDLVTRWRWKAHDLSRSPGKFYAVRNAAVYEGGRRRNVTIAMHQLVFGPVGAGERVDHENGNSLDNRRENLRRATHAQNIQNCRPRRHKSCAFKGVCERRRKAGGVSYEAQIRIGAEGFYLGTHESAEAAARVYDAKAVELFGEFAYLNFPEEHGRVPTTPRTDGPGPAAALAVAGGCEASHARLPEGAGA